MRDRDALIGGIAVFLAVTGAGMLARKGAEASWTTIADKPPPKDLKNDEVDLTEAVLWAVISGVAVGVARTLVRRGAAIKGLPSGARRSSGKPRGWLSIFDD